MGKRTRIPTALISWTRIILIHVQEIRDMLDTMEQVIAHMFNVQLGTTRSAQLRNRQRTSLCAGEEEKWGNQHQRYAGSQTQHLVEVEGQLHAPAALSPGVKHHVPTDQGVVSKPWCDGLTTVIDSYNKRAISCSSAILYVRFTSEEKKKL
jgi:hypothetical protein